MLKLYTLYLYLVGRKLRKIMNIAVVNLIIFPVLKVHLQITFADKRTFTVPKQQKENKTTKNSNLLN